MMKLIFGSSGSGKSYFCHEKIKEDVKTNNKVILFVPEQFSHETEKKMVRLLGEKDSRKVSVLTFKKLSNRVLKEFGGAKYKYINKASKAMILYNIMINIRGELESFASSASGIGFTNIMLDLLSEIKMYDLSYETLVEYSMKEELDEKLRKKLRDVAIIYNKYEREIKGKYLDAEDELNILYEKLKDYNGFNNAKIYMDDFFFFTPQQYKIIEMFIKKANKVTITLPRNEKLSRDVFKNVELTEAKLLRVAENVSTNIEKPLYFYNTEEKTKFKSSELMHLEDNFFRYPFVKYNNEVKDISLFKSVNSFGECEYICTQILNLVRDDGYRFRDIAVVSGGIGDYEKNLKVMFEQYDIPVFVDKKMPMIDNPFVIFISSILDILELNWNYETIFRYLKTGLLDIERNDIDFLENYVLKRGIKGKKWIKEFISIDEADDEMERLNLIRKKVIDPLVRLQENLRGNRNVRAICEELYNFLVELSITDKLESLVMEFKLSGYIDKANEYGEILKITMEILDKMVESFDNQKMNLKTFRRLINVAFEQYEIGIIPSSIDQVLVGDVARVRTANIRVLFIIGGNEGVFPASGSSENIIGDEERLVLRENGVELAPTTLEKVVEDQYLTYKTLSIPSEKLFITHSIAGADGKSKRESMVVSKIKKIFPRIVEHSDIDERENEFMLKITSQKATFNNLLSSYRQLERNKNWHVVEQWYMKNENWKHKYAGAIRGLNFKNVNRRIGPKRISALYGTHLNFSPSRIESYSKCPFSYFVEKGLRAKERKIYEFSAPDVGSLMHEVLSNFSVSIIKNNISVDKIDDEIIEKEIERILEIVLINRKYNILKSSPKYNYMLKKIKKTILRCAKVVVYHFKVSDFTNYGTEVSIGINKDIPEVKLALPSGNTIYLNGQIDRIDTFEDDGETYIRIIDYKSSAKKINLSDIYYTMQIQLIMYLDMILKNENKVFKGEVIPGAVLYFRMDDPFISGNRTMTDSKVQEEIMKKLKMKGFILKDAKIITHMDKNISGFSLIIPANIGKAGQVGKMSSVVTKKEFEILREYVNYSITNICEDIIAGVVDVKPLRSNNECACTFCKFRAICTFDKEIEGNNYRNIAKISEEEAMIRMKKVVDK